MDTVTHPRGVRNLQERSSSSGSSATATTSSNATSKSSSSTTTTATTTTRTGVPLYSAERLAGSIQQLLKRVPLPPVFMTTVSLAVRLHPGPLVPWCSAQVIPELVARGVWERRGGGEGGRGTTTTTTRGTTTSMAGYGKLLGGTFSQDCWGFGDTPAEGSEEGVGGESGTGKEGDGVGGVG